MAPPLFLVLGCVNILVFFAVTSSFAYDFDKFPSPNSLRTPVPVQTQAAAVEDLIGRVVPHRASSFSVSIDPSIGPKEKDTFKLLAESGQVKITGTSGVAAAWGFYYYLSQYCHSHISWAGNQVSLPPSLPAIPQPGVKVTSNDRFRYYQNVCTPSYSFAWWDWARWEQEIDWMAMNGINLPLAFNAQEAIWQRVFLKMNFSQEEIDSFLGGPPFQSWSRMGNMQGWGGPEPQSWHTQQVELQHKILDRMRSLGIIPVLPAFAGFVPRTIKEHYPDVTVTKMSDWGNFDPKFCCVSLLNVTDPLFKKIGKMFLDEYSKEFGTNHIYNTDTFNEMTPESSDPDYLRSAGQGVFAGMTAGDPDAIWLMQGWLFQSPFWNPPQAKALLTSVPQGRMIVLDLMSEARPVYQKYESFYGQPFIWCMLHNFGGTLALYGVIDSINEGPFTGRVFPNSTMIGTGLTPEGINQNDVIYEFMNENSWRTKPRNLTAWFDDYALRRYGQQNTAANKAWQLLKSSVYNCTTGHIDGSLDVIVVWKPSVQKPLKPDIWYKPEDLFAAWENMLKAAHDLESSSLYLYDLVDVARESLQVISIKFYNDVLAAYKSKDLDGLKKAGGELLGLLADLDRLLATCDQFLLGRWLESAKAFATNDQEKKYYEYNARTQITLWGPKGNVLDYANKEWAGLVNSYYHPRWHLFIVELQEALITGVPFNETRFDDDVFKIVEQTFTEDTTIFSTKPVGNSVEITSMLFAKYRQVTKAEADFFRDLYTAPWTSLLGRGHSWLSGA